MSERVQRENPRPPNAPARGGQRPRLASRVRDPDGKPPEYHVRLAPGWRQDPAEVAAIEERTAAARTAGLSETLERVGLEWTPDAGLPAVPDRLVLSQADDDAVLLDVLARVSRSSLDAHTRAALRHEDEAAVAARDLVDLGSYPGPRGWWRLAHSPGGDLVGAVFPSRNYENAIIAYVGVVPEQRGHGYARDLLVAGTRLLADTGEPRVRADTDLGNAPMRAAFEAVGYRPWLHRLVLSAPG